MLPMLVGTILPLATVILMVLLMRQPVPKATLNQKVKARVTRTMMIPRTMTCPKLNPRQEKSRAKTLASRVGVITAKTSPRREKKGRTRR